MKMEVSRVDVWAASIKDRPGALAKKLEDLAQAGINLEFEFEVIVFSLRQQSQKPKSKSRNGSMQRMSLKKLQQLLADE